MRALLLSVLLGLCCLSAAFSAEEKPELTIYTYAPLKMEYANCADLKTSTLPKKYAGFAEHQVYKKAVKLGRGILIFSAISSVENTDGGYSKLFHTLPVILFSVNKTTITNADDFEKAIILATPEEQISFSVHTIDDSQYNPVTAKGRKSKKDTRTFILSGSKQL